MTGGTGFIGAHLRRRLLLEGHEVHVLSRSSSLGDELGLAGKKSAAHLLSGDLLDANDVRNLVERIQPDAVVHLASRRPMQGTDDDARLMFRTNALATYDLLDACAHLPGPCAVVFASAMSVYNYEAPRYLPVDECHPTEPFDTYGLSKVLAEQCCEYVTARSSSLSCIILRISGVYGPGKHSGLVYNCLNSVATGTSVRISRSDVRRDFVYVSDVIDAIMRALATPIHHRTAIYNIGGGRSSSLIDVAVTVERVTRGTVNLEFTSAIRDTHFYLDTRKAEEALGFRPRSLEAAITDWWSVMAEAEKSAGGRLGEVLKSLDGSE